MNAIREVSPDEDSREDRWRQWQLRNAIADRRSAGQARLVFIAVVAALGVWLGLLWLAPLRWP
jgi:hypothetical protein